MLFYTKGLWRENVSANYVQNMYDFNESVWQIQENRVNSYISVDD